MYLDVRGTARWQRKSRRLTARDPRAWRRRRSGTVRALRTVRLLVPPSHAVAQHVAEPIEDEVCDHETQSPQHHPDDPGNGNSMPSGKLSHRATSTPTVATAGRRATARTISSRRSHASDGWLPTSAPRTAAEVSKMPKGKRQDAAGDLSSGGAGYARATRGAQNDQAPKV